MGKVAANHSGTQASDNEQLGNKTPHAQRPRKNKPHTKASPTKRRTKRAKGWVPDQHGAWFMVTVPALTGALLSPSWTAVAVLLTWWFGYFTFFAAGIWIRSRFRDTNRPPVFAYGALTALAGIVALIADWTLIRWIPAFLPLVAIAVHEAWKRRPRSLLSGVSTVIAACLMTPVVASASSGGFGHHAAWVAFAVYVAFFVGTVPYVKTLIRERGHRNWLIGSVTYHVGVLIASIIGTAMGLVHWFAIIVAVVLVARSYLMPYTGERRNQPWRPKTVGLIEAVITVLVVAAALL